MSRSKQRSRCQHSCVSCKSWKKGYPSLTAQDAKSLEDAHLQLEEAKMVKDEDHEEDEQAIY